jgi:hypothetical protein
MEPTDRLRVGDVVQIDPTQEGCFRGCFMLVTESRSWGAMGYVACPVGDAMPGRGYYRCPWEHMEYIGRATWIPADDLPELGPDGKTEGG